MPTDAEWALLKWSQRLNNMEPELDQKQELRSRNLSVILDQEPDSLAVKYHNAIGEEMRRQA